MTRAYARLDNLFLGASRRNWTSTDQVSVDVRVALTRKRPGERCSTNARHRAPLLEHRRNEYRHCRPGIDSGWQRERDRRQVLGPKAHRDARQSLKALEHQPRGNEKDHRQSELSDDESVVNPPRRAMRALELPGAQVRCR